MAHLVATLRIRLYGKVDEAPYINLKFWSIHLWWQLAIGRRLVKIEHRYIFGGALFMLLTSAAYLLLAGR
jgi:hypothetical protein